MNSAPQTRKMVIGLVGGIGAGKSVAADAFKQLGGIVIAGDPLGHEALEQPEISARIKEIWGERDVFDENGKVNRKKLGRIVFPSPVERTRLEYLVHPYIEQRMRAEIEKGQGAGAVKFIVVDAAIMLEAGWNNVCDKLVYIDAPRTLRLERVQTQRGWTETDLKNREAVQMPPEKKKALADAVIDNSGTMENTQQQVQVLCREWKLV
jgi:dephospho-CoA kinase